jgi:hypothetical protein
MKKLFEEYRIVEQFQNKDDTKEEIHETKSIEEGIQRNEFKS